MKNGLRLITLPSDTLTLDSVNFIMNVTDSAC